MSEAFLFLYRLPYHCTPRPTESKPDPQEVLWEFVLAVVLPGDGTHSLLWTTTPRGKSAHARLGRGSGILAEKKLPPCLTLNDPCSYIVLSPKVRYSRSTL